MPPDRISGWLNSACWTVSCISLQSAGSLLLCQEYRRTRKCQRYSPKWLSTLSMIWQIITDFLKLLSDKEKNDQKIQCITLFISYCSSLYSLGVFFSAKDTKAGAIEGCQTWMSLTLSVTECMSSLDIYVSFKPEVIKILKLCVFLMVIFLLDFNRLDFNQVLRHEKTVCPVYCHFSIHSMQAMAICSRKGFNCLNCGISRLLKSWPFRCTSSMHLCMVALWLFNKDEVWNVLVWYFFLNVVISSSLNDSAQNILNDVLKIMLIWFCCKLALQWF